jgi:hypothetical protein
LFDRLKGAVKTGGDRTTNAVLASVLRDIDRELQGMVAGAIEPYDAATDVYEMALDHLELCPDVMHPLWLLWAALADWFEVKPEEQAEADGAALRAATEWLSLGDDPQSRKSYFEHWVFEEMGYERPIRVEGDLRVNRTGSKLSGFVFRVTDRDGRLLFDGTDDASPRPKWANIVGPDGLVLRDPERFATVDSDGWLVWPACCFMITSFEAIIRLP